MSDQHNTPKQPEANREQKRQVPIQDSATPDPTFSAREAKTPIGQSFAEQLPGMNAHRKAELTPPETNHKSKKWQILAAAVSTKEETSTGQSFVKRLSDINARNKTELPPPGTNAPSAAPPAKFTERLAEIIAGKSSGFAQQSAPERMRPSLHPER